MLAAQFGEHLEPCGTSCDVCTGDDVTGQAQQDRQETPRRSRRCLEVLRAVKTLPFPMGRPGLVRLLLGSAESRVRQDRSQYFGALADFTVSSAGRLVDRLTEQGYLFRDTDHEFYLISLTDKGRNASVEDLASEFVVSGRRVGRERKATDGEIPPELPVDEALFERLAEWRTSIARRDQVPPYVVALNTMLEAVASTKPRTLAQLQNLPGFGPVKCEKYGEEILKLVNGQTARVPD